MSDLIDRQAAIDALAKNMPSLTTPDGCGEFDHDIQVTDEAYVDCMQIIHELPSAQPEIKPIEYRDCANAMLRMWMDNVVTDGEYSRIMDKLNKHWRENDDGSD